jgi:hypothetical protein
MSRGTAEKSYKEQPYTDEETGEVYLPTYVVLERYGRTRGHLDNLVKNGLLQPYQIPGNGKQYFYKQSDVHQLFTKPIPVTVKLKSRAKAS